MRNHCSPLDNFIKNDTKHYMFQLIVIKQMDAKSISDTIGMNWPGDGDGIGQLPKKILHGKSRKNIIHSKRKEKLH